MKALGITSIDLQIAEGKRHGFYNYRPWADIVLTATDKFLKELGLLEGEPTLTAGKGTQKLVKQH